MPSYIWLIPTLPVVGLLLILILTFRRPRISGYLGILAIGAALVLSLAALSTLLGAGEAGRGPFVSTVEWYRAGTATFDLGFIFDPLAATMLVVVTLVSLLVHIYSQGYMDGDPGY